MILTLALVLQLSWFELYTLILKKEIVQMMHEKDLNVFLNKAVLSFIHQSSI